MRDEADTQGGARRREGRRPGRGKAAGGADAGGRLGRGSHCHGGGWGRVGTRAGRAGSAKHGLAQAQMEMQVVY